MTPSQTATKTIEGFVAHNPKESLQTIRYEVEPITDWNILVNISHCGICHSDLHLINNDWGVSVYPLIPGHEIIGTVVEKGSQVIDLEIGQRVGIGWQIGSCHKCEWCYSAQENLCSDSKATCNGHPGGFATAIVADSRMVVPIPEGLKSENAAPLLCGGTTVFSPFEQYKVNATWRVGVIGIGGLGHLALQFARAFGCEVFAFSSSADKESEAKKFGAHHFISSKDVKALEKAANSIDLLLFTSSAPADYAAFMNTLRPKGQLCVLGAPEGGHIDVPNFNLIVGRKVLCGSNIASPHVIRTMLRIAEQHGIEAQTELFHMNDVNAALKKVAENKVHYRAVLYN